ncbi:NAD-glutamate dehydrogenase [Undibacterium sp.]|uniref:NAD-glutamate dehydrogenase n=1 Tax=Undibacterium sp. TaxID=1914977 RepID=UPI00374DEFE0
MSSVPEQGKAAFVAQIQQIMAQTVAAAEQEQARQFVSQYYGDVDEEDFLTRDPKTWAAIAQSHYQFGREFASGAPKIRIFNPKLSDNGWDAARTVVEFINDDMPFLVDSISMEINRQGGAVQFIVHPLFAAERDAKGVCSSLAPAHGGKKQESWIHIELDKITDPKRLAELEEGLRKILSDVRSSVEDWPQMTQKVPEILASLGGAAKVVPLEELDEARAFLHWMADNHFTFIGYREYELKEENGQDVMHIVANSGLGILREPKAGGISESFMQSSPEVRELARKPQILVLTKANSRATVHRAGYLDYVGIKTFDANGKVTGARRFVGLYTSSAYHAYPKEIPLLRNKLSRVMQRAGFPEHSHAGKSLVSIFETLPRDELFQIGEDELFNTVMGILHLGERSRTRLFVRRDDYARFYSCLIYLPRESYNTEVRIRMQDILKRAFNGISVEFNLQLSESALARVHMLVRTDPGPTQPVDVKALEAQLAAAVRRWEEGVFEHLGKMKGEETANQARSEFALSFPAAYREDVSIDQAVDDFLASRSLSSTAPVAMSLYRPAPADVQSDALSTLRFRLYSLGQAVPLSGSLPMLENMGVRVESERSYVIERANLPPIHIHDFGLSHTFGDLQFEQVKPKFEESFARIWGKEVENDGFNRLTLAAALSSDEIVMLRTYAKYLKQAGFTYSQSYIEQTLSRHSGITQALVRLFHARFVPAHSEGRDKSIAMAAAAIEGQLDKVAVADEDFILRRFLAVLQASLRTNYYQIGEGDKRKPYLSIKFDSSKIPELPQPRPMFEIFVYSPRVEGIHLRGGKVARGGLRWSDRPEDFRTEVLGLVKAQMVKNAVIVPVGSKGGFVLKAAPPASEREAYLKEGVACYQTFLRGLLDVTDNLIKGKVVHPEGVVRHDADDPYLVVAADKGTATFSDYANAISAEYNFWLGDAFASGGSVGYDHKKMGITARGAWESVKRHFREFGVDTQSTEFTVAGVGDMSGDVFGNGMLLSKHIRLIAAFDHRHIFLDPTPVAASSFAERERLFNLPRSSWEDYDKSLISAGGGVFSRGAKSVPLSPEIQAALDINAQSMTPVELMRAILKAPVDLLYNGGIGTYVKASYQSHDSVGDRATDALRVNGNELRCKVVAEGGNLGCTQLGRIEYAMSGGRINTDAIDNSAGVDCSDHEVNIKILLNAVIEGGALPESERNELLASMTDEVGLLVLKDNYYQTQSLAVSGVRSDRMVDAQARFIRHLEKAGRLDRAVEYLPSEEKISERKAAKQGLTSPERAVLLAYSKMELFDELIKSDLIDDDYVAQALTGYFPQALQQRFADIMPRHPLKREIIATVIANDVINSTGSVFVHRMREETGATAPEVVRCFILAREVFGISKLWKDIDALDGKVPAPAQSEMLIDAGRLILRATLWFLRRRSIKMPITQVLEFFSPGAAVIARDSGSYLAEEDLNACQAAQNTLAEQGVPEQVAQTIARLDNMYALLDVVETSHESGRPVELAAALYFKLGGKLGLRWVASQISKLPSDTHWQTMARAAMRDDLASLQRQMTAGILAHSPDLKDPDALLAAWEEHSGKALVRVNEVMTDVKAARESDLAMLSVLLRELRMLA